MDLAARQLAEFAVGGGGNYSWHFETSWKHAVAPDWTGGSCRWADGGRRCHRQLDLRPKLLSRQRLQKGRQWEFLNWRGSGASREEKGWAEKIWWSFSAEGRTGDVEVESTEVEEDYYGQTQPSLGELRYTKSVVTKNKTPRNLSCFPSGLLFSGFLPGALGLVSIGGRWTLEGLSERNGG